MDCSGSSLCMQVFKDTREQIVFLVDAGKAMHEAFVTLQVQGFPSPSPAPFQSQHACSILN